jgi:hypothetical protein
MHPKGSTTHPPDARMDIKESTEHLKALSLEQKESTDHPGESAMGAKEPMVHPKGPSLEQKASPMA